MQIKWSLELRQKDASAGNVTANDNVRNNSRAMYFTRTPVLKIWSREWGVGSGEWGVGSGENRLSWMQYQTWVDYSIKNTSIRT
jgi:hypothetical protein